MALIFLVSAQPDLPDVGMRGLPLDFLLKKTAHFLEYAVLAGLTWRAALATRHGWRGGRWLPFLVWLATIGYAATDELHQAFVPGRNARAEDMLIDALGAGVALVLIVRRARSNPRQPGRESGN